MLHLLCPKLYVNSVLEIPLRELKELGIKGLIFDLDNTIIGWDREELMGNPGVVFRAGEMTFGLSGI